MKGANVNNKEELKNSWDNPQVQHWLVNDGVGTMTNIYREDAATGEQIPYDKFTEKIMYYLKQVEKKQKDAYIKGIY